MGLSICETNSSRVYFKSMGLARLYKEEVCLWNMNPDKSNGWIMFLGRASENGILNPRL